MLKIKFKTEKCPAFFYLLFMATPGVLHYKNGNMTDIMQLIQDPCTKTSNFYLSGEVKTLILSSLPQTAPNHAASSKQKMFRGMGEAPGTLGVG